MEILVLIMLALLLLIIAFSIVLFVILRKNSVTKSFNRNIDREDFDDELADDDSIGNIVLPSNFFNHENQIPINNNNSEANETINNNISEAFSETQKVDVQPIITPIVVDNDAEEVKEETVDVDTQPIVAPIVIDNNTVEVKEETVEVDTQPIVTPIVVANDAEEVKEETVEVDTQPIVAPIVVDNNTAEVKEETVEVVNVLIDKKNHILLANNHQVSKNDRIKLIIDNKVYFGTVTKGNYMKELKSFKVKPRKLILVDKKKKKEVIMDDVEIIPIKKNKNDEINN